MSLMLYYGKMFHVICVCLVILARIRASLIEINQGKLNGTILKSRNGNNFYTFYGIPYAQPPVGKLRFEPPQEPPPSWQGIRQATSEPEVCPQMDTWFRQGYFGSEDCLFLQVFTRDTDPSELMPVLVYFHGGLFSAGSGLLYGPRFLMDKPIVMVSVNSRVGVFGFFSTGDTNNSGNYGLKDQVAALKWIQKNIHLFGGNAESVTILGQSSGAASAHLHSLSPLSEHLFHRAIIQSGSATPRWAFDLAEGAQKKFQKFRQHANCSRSTITESVACLKGMSAENLKKSEITFVAQDPTHIKFRPVVEGAENVDAFLITNPTKYMYFNPDRPFIFGFTSNEASSFFEQRLPQRISDEELFNSVLPIKLDYNIRDNPALVRNITSVLKKLYFGNNISNYNPETASVLVSDVLFKLNIVDAISTYPGREYAYEYDYFDPQISNGPGVGHNDDMESLFDSKINLELNEEHRKVSETMVTYWTNFILTGNPNTPDGDLPTNWKPVKTAGSSLEYLHISNKGFKMREEIMHGKDEFWEYYKLSQEFRV